MNRIESYITSIILSNADRYIKNFRKQDAQVSLWGGDASFYNIELNVDALNEELPPPFFMTSGFIYNLVIHVPWTKLTSESVTVDVNTMECVMKVRKQDSTNESGSPCKNRPIMDDIDIIPPSYISSITSKIINNLTIRCKNFILKFVEEDVVFSMNVEQITYSNVDQNWQNVFTDTKADQLSIRKLIECVGVTVCLDQLNSFGRIETYLEPILYRCDLNIKVCKYYNSPFSKKPFKIQIDVLSEMASFTFSEPQISMLSIVVSMIVFAQKQKKTNSQSITRTDQGSNINAYSSDGHSEASAGVGADVGWGEWIWNMIPQILPDEATSTFESDPVSASTHLGLYIRCLEIKLKTQSLQSTKVNKKDYKCTAKGCLKGCYLELVNKDCDWFNVRCGITSIYVEPIHCCCGYIGDCDSKPFLSVNWSDTCDLAKDDFLGNSLFTDEQENLDTDEMEDFENFIEKQNVNMKSKFNMESHLSVVDEKSLLRRTAGLAVDYLIHFGDEVSNLEGDRYTGINRCEKVFETLTRVFLGPCDIFATTSLFHHAERIYSIYNEITRISSNIFNLPADDAVSNQLTTTRTNHKMQIKFCGAKLELIAPSHDHSKKIMAYVKNTENVKKGIVFCVSYDCLEGNNTKQIKTNGHSESHYSFKISNVKSSFLISGLDLATVSKELLSIPSVDVEYRNIKFRSERRFKFVTNCSNVQLSKADISMMYHMVNSHIELLVGNGSLNNRKSYYMLNHSTLPNDVEKSGISMKISASDVVAIYTLGENVNAYYLSVGKYVANIENLRDANQPNGRIPILSSRDNQHFLRITIQTVKSPASNRVQFLIVKLSELDVNLDETLFHWLEYEPIVTRHLKRNLSASNYIQLKKVEGESIRKVSRSQSSGSRSKRIGGNLATQPIESVHNSAEKAFLNQIEKSPDLDEITGDTSLSPENSPEAKKHSNNPTEGLILDFYRDYRNTVLSIVISNISIYVPSISLSSHRSSVFTEKVDNYFIQNVVPTLPDSCGVLAFSCKSARIKCDLPNDTLDQIGHNIPLDIPMKYAQSFPWNVDFEHWSLRAIFADCAATDIISSFTSRCLVDFPLQKALNVKVTLCIHVDTEPIIVTVTDNHVKLINDCWKNMKSFARERSKEISKKQNPNEKYASEYFSTKDETGAVALEPKKRVKLNGLVQCTFASISLRVESNESHQIRLDWEDSIVSIEFDAVFHKFKIKFPTFSMRHYVRSVDGEWKNGPYAGSIVTRRHLIAEDCESGTQKDAFLIATITRASSSHFHSIVSPTQPPLLDSKQLEHFITEIIIKLCPLDVILALDVLEKFISSPFPLISGFSGSTEDYVSPDEGESKRGISTFPMVYFDTNLLRVFIPVPEAHSNDGDCSDYKTFLIAVSAIHTGHNDDNLIPRHPIRPDLYWSAATKNILSIPGSQVEDKQYLIEFDAVAVDTVLWSEVQTALLLNKPQEIESICENPALMWNQGRRPSSPENAIFKSAASLLRKCDIRSVYASPIYHKPSNVVICVASAEINIASDLTILCSGEQITLILSLWNKLQNLSQKLSNGKCSKFRSKRSEDNCYLDSGIESMEQSCHTESSGGNEKNDAKNQFPKVHQRTRSNASNITKSDNENVTPLLKVKSKNRIMEIDYIISAKKIFFTFYNNLDDGSYKPLICGILDEINFSIDTDFDKFVQNLIIYKLKIVTPNKVCKELENISGDTIFEDILAETGNLNKDPKTGIPYSTFRLTTSGRNNEINSLILDLGQEIFIFLTMFNLQRLKYISKLANECIRKTKKNNKVIRSEVSQKYRLVEYILNFFGYPRSLKLTFKEIMITYTKENLARFIVRLNEKSEFSFEYANDNKLLATSVFMRSCTVSTLKVKNNIFRSLLSRRKNLVAYLAPALLIKPCDIEVKSSICLAMENNKYYDYFHFIIGNIVIEFSDFQHRRVNEFLVEYSLLFSKYSNVKSEKTFHSEIQEFKDDLRAGVFHYVQSDFELPSPYEIVFCEKPSNYCMMWRYPNRRILKNLQIYPVPIEREEDFSEIRCKLQYYDEVRSTFETFMEFSMPKNCVERVSLPDYKKCPIPASCWRVLLANSESDNLENANALSPKFLAGSVRIDSMYDASLTPEYRFIIDVESARLNINTINNKDGPVLFESFRSCAEPTEQQICQFNAGNIFINYQKFKTQNFLLKINSKIGVDIVNLEYRMLQSFVEPFIFSWEIYPCFVDITMLIGNVILHASPSTIHSVTALLHYFKGGTYALQTPYILCNDTNGLIYFGQYQTDEKICLEQERYFSYSWYNFNITKRLCFYHFIELECFTSDPVNVEIPGEFGVICSNENNKKSALIISIEPVSSIIKRVVIRGTVTVFNETDHRLKLYLEIENGDFISRESCYISERNNSTLMIPFNWKPVMKIRLAGNKNKENWSVPIPVFNSNASLCQRSWIVKIPKFCGNSFKAIWCQVTWETVDNIPIMVIALTPFCSLVSYLPWDVTIRVMNNKQQTIGATLLEGRGIIRDCNILDVLSANNLFCHLEETELSSRVSLENREEVKLRGIKELIIGLSSRKNEILKWPLVDNLENFDLTSVKTPLKEDLFNLVCHKNDFTPGVSIKIYPWALFINTVGVDLLLKSDEIVETLLNDSIGVPDLKNKMFSIGIVTDYQIFYCKPVKMFSQSKNSEGFSMAIKGNNSSQFLSVDRRLINEINIVHFSSTYHINNRSSINMEFIPFAVAKLNSSPLLNVPETLPSKLILPSSKSEEYCKAITNWINIGSDETAEVFPFLIFFTGNSASKPFNLINLKENERYQIIFSSNRPSREFISTILTVKKCSQIYYLTIWDEPIPPIIICNASQLRLSVASSKYERGTLSTTLSKDWNFKTNVHCGERISFACGKDDKYLIFSVANEKCLSKTKWSDGVALKCCENKVVLLPLSQHHIKVTIKQQGLTYELTIISELPSEVDIFLSEENRRETEVVSNTSLNFRLELTELSVRFCYLGIDSTECDVFTTNLMGIIVAIENGDGQKKCDVRIAGIQCDNDEYRTMNYDFPVVLFAKSDDEIGYDFNQTDNSCVKTAIAASITFNASNDRCLEICDIVIKLSKIHAYVEDKYVKRLKSAMIEILSCSKIVSLFNKKRIVKGVTETLKEVEKSVKFEESRVISKNKRKNERVNTDDEKHLADNESIVLSVSDGGYYVPPATNNIPNNEEYRVSIFDLVYERDESQSIDNISCDKLCRIPKEVAMSLTFVAKPLRMRCFHVHPVNLVVSARTSTAFYVALDETPLSMSEFKLENFSTTTYELGNMLTVHYFMNAMYGTGWALGSLEFVGSPACLARNVGTGIKDFVSLPLYGMANGPEGFIMGIANGSASLMKHVVQGTLKSVTNFAGSWSRTLDRLSLDSDDLLQCENIRRSTPSNISEGILLGLSEFGISLLGGISGIAHHPLQYATAPEDSKRRLLSSIGLGLVGVFTRPLSGAAGLVARTGQGILSHVGWTTLPQVKKHSDCSTWLSLSSLTFKWKRANEREEVILAVAEAMSSAMIPIVVVLTKTALLVYDGTAENTLGKYYLRKHYVTSDPDDCTLITIWKPISRYQEISKWKYERIMEYVAGANKYLPGMHSDSASTKLSDEAVFSFYISHQISRFICSIIEFAKKDLQ